MGIYKINENDNVIIALKNFKKGEKFENIEVLDDVLKGHKIACKDIAKGENIVKYNCPIGSAKNDIKAGQHVHTHNIVTNLDGSLEYTYNQKFESFNVSDKKRTVNVYKRDNEQIGIRNELWIVPTVGCVNQQAINIIEKFKSTYDTSSIDGVYTFTHPYGCSQMGEDHENTKITLQNIAKHPNAGGVLVLGLGCENNQIADFENTLGDYDKNRIKFLAAQDVSDEIEEGVKILTQLFDVMKTDKRVEMPFSCLNIGLECGGSDAFSGITANPLVGQLSDYTIEHGGTVVLTEVPEMFGAEHILMQRAKDKETYDKIVSMINGFKDYYKRHNQVVYENPSPGNKKGGISTLEDKSLGCTQKAGYSKVIDVLEHGEVIKQKGLNLLTAPGNDLVATTALGMANCHLVLFTTGRGTPFGGFIPTVKISTQTDLFERKPNWIDFNAGSLLDGVSMEDLTEQFLDYVVEVVNGKLTNNEKNNFREIAIFKSGVTL